MNLLTDAMGGLGGALLPVVAGLLLEELTLGGLVRLLIAPRPDAHKQLEHNRQRETGNDRIEIVFDVRGSASAGHLAGNSTVWTVGSVDADAPQGCGRN
jgi:hypothetical protein